MVRHASAYTQSPYNAEGHGDVGGAPGAGPGKVGEWRVKAIWLAEQRPL